MKRLERNKNLILSENRQENAQDIEAGADVHVVGLKFDFDLCKHFDAMKDIRKLRQLKLYLTTIYRFINYRNIPFQKCIKLHQQID